MVNQSLSCGTPVVAFKIGIALDVVDNKGGGFCANLKDSKDFAEGIYKLYSMSNDEYSVLRETCRKIAMETTSTKTSVNYILDIFAETIGAMS